MRVTLKSVNVKLTAIGAKTELAKGAGYFLFRGGEAEEWIDRTVRVPIISALTMEQWVGEYERLKALNEDMTKASDKPAPAKHQPAPEPKKHHVEAPKPPVREQARKEECSVIPKLLAELEEAHKDL